uniref:Uncharacterized protein n=1 Tax=Tanacetum cinerariifolium TaxID=118510 RepID=A0A6L2JBI6_TANCI|nr:hypothetical protein [Tanacetum cinerariifolium]
MENQEQIPSQQEQSFVAAKQVSFNLEVIILNTNNKVALLYPKHNNKDYFKCVSDFIFKCCLRKPFTRSPDMYKEYLGEFWYSATALDNSKVSFSIPTGGIFGEVGVNTFRNGIGAHYLAYSSEYVAPLLNDVVSKEAIKGRSSKEPTGSKTGHSKKRKDSSLAMDSNLSQPSVSTTVDLRMHKEDQQRIGGPTSLEVTSEARANRQLSSGMSAFNLNEPIYTSSFIIHPESALGDDASAVSIAKADLGNSAPSDFVPQQQGINEGTKNTSYDYLFAGKGSNSIDRHVEEEEAFRTIKLEDLAKLVSNVQPSFKDLDSPEDYPVIIIEESCKEENKIHATENVETEDTSVPKSSSPKSSLIQELTNQVLILQPQKNKLELEKNKAEATFLKAQPSFPNVEQLKELLVKSLKTKLLNILSTTDFSSSLPTESKDIPSKLNEFTEEILKDQQWYRSQVSKFSKHNVYSTKAILGVQSVSGKKLHVYGHLEVIAVKRSDQELYKFKEGDFVDLHLNDIKDMLLLVVQHKLFYLDGSVIVDFIIPFCMFKRSLILKRHVKYLELGVESYQKKFNITKPWKTFPEIKFREPYTPSCDPPGIVYEDLNKEKRVLRADKLYKFLDDTLKFVRDEIHHKVLEFRLDYNTEMPKRKWTAIDQKRSGLIIELIDKQLR